MEIAPDPAIVGPWAEKPICYEVTVPAAPTTTLMVNPAVVTATSRGDGSQYDVSSHTIIINQDPGLTFESDESETGDPADLIRYEHTLENTGNYHDNTIDLTWETDPDWEVRVNGTTEQPLEVFLPQGETMDVFVDVIIPSDATCDMMNTTIVTATSFAGLYKGQVVEVSVKDVTHVATIGGVEIEEDEKRNISSNPTQPIVIDYSHRLTNTGNCSVPPLNILGHSSQGFTVDIVPSPTVQLEPGEAITVDVSVTVPPTDTANLVVDTTIITASCSGGYPADSVVDTSIVNQIPGLALAPNNTGVLTQASLVPEAPPTPMQYTHTLTNSGNYTDAFELTWHNKDGWSVDVEGQTEQPVHIPVGGQNLTRTVQLTVSVPWDAYTVTNHTVLTAASGFSPTVHAVASDTTMVRRPHVTLDPDYGREVVPGAVLTHVHTLSNSGGISDTYVITYASSLGWAEIEPPTVYTLSPGSAVPVTATISVPLTGSQALSGTTDLLVITATSHLTPALSDTAVDTTTVAYAPAAEIVPSWSGQGRAGEPIVYTHTLINTGNYTETFNLVTWSEFANASVSPPSVPELGPSEAYTPVVVTVLLPAHVASGETEQTQLIATFANQQSVVNDYSLVMPISGTRYVAPGGIDENNSCLAPYEYGPCATVQQAVDQAVTGDEARVAQGVYTDVQSTNGYTSVVYLDKRITLRGGYASDAWEVSDPATRETVLDAGGQGRVVVIAGEDITPTLEGFHLRHGRATGNGAGLYIAGAVPTVRLNQIYSNTATAPGGFGGGVYYDGGGTPALQRNDIYSNTAEYGAGLYIATGSPRVWNSLIYHNHAAEIGGGLYNAAGSPLVWNSTFYSNTATSSGGGVYLAAGSPVISNTIVAENTRHGIAGTAAGSVLAYNDVIDNSPANYSGVSAGSGSISVAPRFVDASNGDFHLRVDSPVIDSGDPDGTQPDVDREGNARPLPQSGRHDIGAYENSLGLVKSVAEVAPPGTTITYTITVSNYGDAPRSVLVTDTLHTYLDYVALHVDTGSGDYTPDDHTLSWSGTVDPDTLTHITFTARITDWLAAGTLITNTAWLDGAPASTTTTEIGETPGPRYVTTGGSDEGNNCLVSDRPCGTIQYAVDRAIAQDEVRVAAGTYTGIGQVVSVDKAISLIGGYNPANWAYAPDAYTTTLEAPGGGAGVAITGPTAGSVRLAGLDITGGENGVTVDNATTVISRCLVHSNTVGIYVSDGDPTLERTWVYGNADDGVKVENGAYTLVNNVIGHNQGAGLRTSGSAGTVLHNTFARNAVAGAIINGTAGFTNSIFYSHTVGISVTTGSTALLSNTLWYSNTTNRNDGGTLVSVPEFDCIPAFANPDTMDYHLTIASEAIEKGIDTGLSEDINGDPRPLLEYPDLGADEFSLVVAKYGPKNADPGQLVTYTFKLEGEESGLVLTDTLDSYLSYAGTLACNRGSCGYLEIGSQQIITWTGDILADQPAHITYTTEITDWLASGVQIFNDAEILVYGQVRHSAAVETTINSVPGARYVAPDGTDEDNNCRKKWKPCATVQQAVDQAQSGDTVNVAQGTYTGDGSNVVWIAKSITLLGGYTTDDDWTSRDPASNTTILDGENSRRVVRIIGPGPVTMDGFHVVSGTVADDGAGFSIIGATVTLVNNQVHDNETQGSGHSGGGIYAAGGSLTLTATQVYNNQAYESGGGIHQEGGSLALYNSQVYGNSMSGSDAPGGGLFLNDVQATLKDNRIATNTANGLGGGLCISTTGSAKLERNVILDNQAFDKGGGAAVNLSAGDLITLTNNILAANEAGEGGEGLYLWGSGDARGDLRHNTLVGNGEEGMRVGDFTLAMTNTILVSHTVGITTAHGAASVVADHTLWDATASLTDTSAGGNIKTTNDLTGNPSFVDPAAMDYHIKGDSAAVRAGAEAEVDADIDGEMRSTPHDVGADQYPLRWSREVWPAEPALCHPVTHSLTLTNVAQHPLSDVKLTDGLPSGARYIDGVNTVTSTVGSAEYLADQRSIVWTGDIDVASNAHIAYTANITPYLTDGTVVTFTAAVSDAVSIFSAGPATVTARTQASTMHKQGQGAVSPEGQTTIGEPITYTVQFTVPAGHVAYEPVVIDILPGVIESGGVVSTTPAMAYADDSLSVTGASTETETISADGRVITWTLNTVTATCGGPQIVTLAFNGRTLNLVDNTDGDVLTNTATISYAEGTPGGVARVISDLQALDLTEPGLTLNHTAARYEDLGMGEGVVITITATNTGTTALHDVAVTDTLQGGWVVGSTGSPLFTDVIEFVDAGGQEYVTFTAQVSDTIGPAATLTATAEARGASIPASMPEADAYKRVYVGTPRVITATTGYPDLVISKNGPAVRSPGQLIAYTLRYTNTGAVRAEGVRITDTVPAQLTGVISSTSASTTVEHTGEDITWSLTTPVSQGVSGSIRITANVPLLLPAGTVLRNSAGITTTTEEPAVTNNTALVTTTVQLPSLSITKTTEPALARTRELLTYTLTVSNTGLGDATDLVLSDTVPLSVTYQSCDSGLCGLDDENNVVTWTMALLPAGEQASVFFNTRVNDDAFAGTSIINHAYGVTCTQGAVASAAKAAGTPLTTTVDLVRALSLKPSSAQSPILPGERVTYTHTLTNMGNTPATFDIDVSAAPSGWAYELEPSGPVSDLAPYQSVVLTLTVDAPHGAAGQAQTYITATWQGSSVFETAVDTTSIDCVPVVVANTLDYSPDPLRIDQGTTFTGTVTAGTPPFNYTWDFGDGVQAGPTGGAESIIVGSHTYDEEDNYHVKLTVTNCGGASSDSVERNIIVNPYHLYLPAVLRNY